MDNVEVEDHEFSSIVDTLVNMFGNILTRDVITAVVENCAGDLNLSAEAIMNITDGNSSENAQPDIAPVHGTSNEIVNSPPMDLISFSITDHNTANTNERESSQPVITERDRNYPPHSDPVTRVNNTNVTSNVNVSSALNVNAPDYVPRRSPLSDSTEGSMSTSQVPISQKKEEPKESITENNTFESLTSYSNVSRKTGALPKKVAKSVKSEPEIKLSPQLRRIADYHAQGFRILIIMRGVPGSGKTYLSRQVVQATIGEGLANYKAHILSTDDFFSLRGSYEFNKYYLRDAHAWNQQRAKSALVKGFSPVIIDNTNIQIWEMEPYVREAVANGYKIEVLEPKTPWAKKPNQLAKKNVHGVSVTNITRMLDNYIENVTGEYLIGCFKLSYPNRMKALVLRNNSPTVPATSNQNQFVPKDVHPATTSKQISPRKHKQERNSSSMSNSESISPEAKDNVPVHSIINPDTLSQGGTNDKAVISTNLCDDIETNDDTQNVGPYFALQKQLEDLEKLEKAWDDNPPWHDNVKNKKDSNTNVETECKPQRESVSIRSRSDGKLLNGASDCSEWADIAMFMPPWSDGTQSVEKKPNIPVEMITIGTSVEMGDTDILNGQTIYKVLSAVPRDINEHHISPYKEKIPEKRMLDKSSMTNDQSITETSRCKNEERHFKAFRKMFKTVPKSHLRDIFDQCRGDVNWAVEIVLDGISNNELQFDDTLDLSDVEEENYEECTCLGAYNIVPDQEVKSENENNDENPSTKTESVSYQRKSKKESSPSDLSIQLKRQIEKNVVISDSYYSQHCLKIRKLRRGESSTTEPEDDTEESENATALVPSQETSEDIDSSDEESNVSTEDLEKIVTMNVGHEFIQSMDVMFGRGGITYPDNVKPKLSIPLSLVNELNALWMESLMHQLDEYDKQSADMVKQDEEFSRRLLAKEIELAEAGIEPEMPDFKEIMDMDFALSLYHKDVAGWRNKEPNNLAAKLTRDKLYNLFPDVPQDTLSELLVAHNNNFKATVEVLLISTGKSEVLEEKNGLVKFVMSKEIARQGKLMEEEKKALSDAEWPLLPKGEPVTMATVNDYRRNADEHLNYRNTSYCKAQEYFMRGMTQVACYYSDVANFHKVMFEQANSRAAASIMQVHALKSPNNATMDLHFLRVAEALEALDLFIDSHIAKLQESTATNNNGSRSLSVFLITGRGLHSHNGPRIKPAVKKRLLARHIQFSERNPGLLCATITPRHQMSHQLPM